MATLKQVKNIKLVICDVDGVLTDGKIIYDGNGIESKNFDVQDGLGLTLLKKCGIMTAIISARASDVVAHRAKDLGIDHVYTAAYPKINAYRALVKDLKVDDRHVCFIGDDLPDLAVMKQVGLAVAVSNAVAEVKRVAHYTTRRSGGSGAVREVVEKILKSQGLWSKILERI
ncbi:MAG: HAD-IIIA family hydrolase [Candidatus Omnitrophica bacterium]|nr:HAD-IIIA family hydrolase [Candidatus Omnitrophota bacterium]